MLFRIVQKENGLVLRDCMKVIYYIMHNNVVTMKLLSQCSGRVYDSRIAAYINPIVSLINAYRLFKTKQNTTNIIDLGMYTFILAKEEEYAQLNSDTRVQFDIVKYAILVRFCHSSNPPDYRRADRPDADPRHARHRHLDRPHSEEQHQDGGKCRSGGSQSESGAQLRLLHGFLLPVFGVSGDAHQRQSVTSPAKRGFRRARVLIGVRETHARHSDPFVEGFGLLSCLRHSGPQLFESAVVGSDE